MYIYLKFSFSITIHHFYCTYVERDKLMQYCEYGGQLRRVGVLSTWILGNQAQAVSLGGRCLYSLSHLPSPVDIISNSTWLIRGFSAWDLTVAWQSFSVTLSFI